MSAVTSGGLRPLLRASVVGTLLTLLTLFVLLRGLLSLLAPGVSDVTLAASGALIVFAATAVGGAAGAWQAALAGAPARREIVAVGAAGPAAVCVVASLALAVVESVDLGRAVLELVAIVGGASAGARAFPVAVLAVARVLRGERGQTSAEYLGALVLVALVVATLVSVAPRIGGLLSETVESIRAGEDPRGQVQGGIPSTPAIPESPVQTTLAGDPEADDDGDGLSNEEERALGTLPGVSDSDGDGVPDGEEYVRGTDPRQGLEPLTEENLYSPWDRLGLSENEWNELEDAVLDEVNPDGIGGFLSGPAADGLTIDENGELRLVPPGGLLYIDGGELEIPEPQMMGVGGGLARGLGKLLGGSARSFGPALSSALPRLSPALRTRLGRVGVGPAPRGPARLPQDVAVNSVPRRPLPLNRSIGRTSHNRALQRDIKALPRGARDIRVNQQQVNAQGQRVGVNRPDLQYTLNGRRHYVEYEGPANPRGAIHRARTRANDPNAVIEPVRIVP